jgi:hypothetical protein
MEESILTITAPDDLIQAVMVAFAAEKGLDVDNATPEELEAVSIDAMIELFREKVLEYNHRLEIMKNRQQQRDKNDSLRQSLKDRKDEVKVKINKIEKVV